VVKNIEEYLSTQFDERWKLPSNAETLPMRTSYCPGLDISPELGRTEAAYNMSLIGILQRIVELGRVDVCLKCSMIMSSHTALPRGGYLHQLFQTFGYLKKYPTTEMVFDPSDPVTDESLSELKDWTSSDFGHLQGKEEFLTNIPEP
jgi:hypothetical protein